MVRKFQCSEKIRPFETSHEGPHKCEVLNHTCIKRCPGCGYYCMLPHNHSGFHEPHGHGNMESATLVCEEDVFHVGERRYRQGETGNPLMCNLVCEELGQGHIHFLPCTAKQADDCQNDKPKKNVTIIDHLMRIHLMNVLTEHFGNKCSL